MNTRSKKKNPIHIAEPLQIKTIDQERIKSDNYPVFCFKYLSDISIKKCTDPKFFYDFLMRLQKLSALGWIEIKKSHKSYLLKQNLEIYMNIKKAKPKQQSNSTAVGIITQK